VYLKLAVCLSMINSTTQQSDDVFEEEARRNFHRDIAPPSLDSNVYDSHDFFRDDSKECEKWERVNVNYAFAKRYFMNHRGDFQDDDYVVFANRTLLYKAKTFEDVDDFVHSNQGYEGAYLGPVSDLMETETRDIYIGQINGSFIRKAYSMVTWK